MHVHELYWLIRIRRPRWFEAALMIHRDDMTGFEEWIRHFAVSWIAGESAVVLWKTRGHVAEAHVAFIGAIQPDELAKILRDMMAMGFERIEVPLMADVGKTCRRVLKGLGFQHEGTLRRWRKETDAKSGKSSFKDMEMWAILNEEAQRG